MNRERPGLPSARKLLAVLAAGLVGWVLALSPGAVGAQDLEAVSALTGVPLPAAYFEEIARNPRAFELPNGLFGPVPLGAARAPAIDGVRRLPVILALFSDSPEPHILAEDVRRALFEGPAGTITAAFDEMSRGRFRLEGDVVPWVRTEITRAEVVGTTNGLGRSSRVGEYLAQALAMVDGAVDFSAYDSDGPDGLSNSGDDDGVVDAVAFEFLEVAASCGGPGIWPHRSGLEFRLEDGAFETDDLTPDGAAIRVNGYIVQSVADCSGETVQTASTIAHEYGHVLGLPDFYHVIGGDNRPEFRRWVLGCWALMAAGAWGCGPVTDREAFGPTHFLAPQKATLGWLDYVEVGEVWDEEFVIEPVQTSGRALRVPLHPQSDEALILEYRTRSGFDHELPADGVLVTHHDPGGQRRPSQGMRYQMRLLEADGNDGLVETYAEGGNRGEAGDAFGASGSVGRLNALTTPGLVLGATGAPSTVALHSIVLSDGVARVRLSTSASPRLITRSVQASEARTLATQLRLAGGLMPYTVLSVSGGPVGLEVTAQEDALVLGGVPGEPGAFELAVRLGDSNGKAFESVIPVSVEAFFMTPSRLLQPFLATDDEPPEPAERSRLDAHGNANGALDIGDVRAWLLSP